VLRSIELCGFTVEICYDKLVLSLPSERVLKYFGSVVMSALFRSLVGSVLVMTVKSVSLPV
jgi:hypothetical protein